MIFKMFSLVVLTVLSLGVIQSNAQDYPCDCTVEISAAVADVVAAETDGWVTPNGLIWQAERLEFACDNELPCDDFIVEKMLTFIDGILDGTFTCECWPEEVPEDVATALEALKDILLNGCAAD